MMKKILAVVAGAGLLVGGAGAAWAATTGGSNGTSAAPVRLAALDMSDTSAQRGGAAARHALQIAADTIHIDRNALVQELRSGKSIADVAREHNVDPKTVIDAIVNAGKQNLDELQKSGKLSADRVQKLQQRLPTAAERLVNHKGLAGKHPRVRRAVRSGVEVAADTIHIDRNALVQELRSGKSIADVAREHNVDPKTVIDAIVNAGKQKLDELQKSGKLSADRVQKLEQRLPTAAERLVNHKFGQRDGIRRDRARPSAFAA
jgi:transposase-like protein